jgi:hypothetical protein
MARWAAAPVAMPYPAATSLVAPVAASFVQKKMIAFGWKPTPVIAWFPVTVALAKVPFLEWNPARASGTAHKVLTTSAKTKTGIVAIDLTVPGACRGARGMDLRISLFPPTRRKKHAASVRRRVEQAA